MASGGGNSFISKPARGWLHPDHLVSKEGITYAVRVSCILIPKLYYYSQVFSKIS